MTIGADHPEGWRDPKPIIDEMVRRIAERFQPWRIIFFRSHIRGAAWPKSGMLSRK
mgnify:CR=1 FL=1